MPFSSSKYLYSWKRLSNLVDLSIEHLSFSNKRKTTILFPSPLTFLQWPFRNFSFNSQCYLRSGGRGGLMVSALDSGAIGSGSGPGRGHCVVFLARHFTLTVPLSTQVYEWVPANLMLAATLRWTSIPSRRE